MGKQGLVVKKTVTVVDGWSFILKGTVGCTLGAGSFKLGPVCAEDGKRKGMRLRFIFVVVIQSLSHVQLFVTPWTAAGQVSLSFTVFWSLLKLLSIESVMPSSHLILRHPLLLPSIFPSIRVFSNESVLRIRWPKHWSFSFSISSSNEYSGLISFRMDWLDLPAIQGTLNSLLQHHSE